MTNLFASLQAPRLTSISGKAIQTFLTERQGYKAAVNAQLGLNPVAWANCFDAICLCSLVQARIFGVQNATVQSLIDNLSKENLESLTEAISRVSDEDAWANVTRKDRLNASEPDVQLRILILQTSNSLKVAVKHLVQV